MSKNIFLSIIAYLVMQCTFAQSTLPVASSGKTIFGSNAKIGKYADIRGIKMYYEVYGTGKPLLLIHGNGGSLENFKNQIPYFAKNYKVIAVDSRAHGKSVDTGDSLSYEMMADDFDALLTKLSVDSCYVIGWSDGGINGLLLAIRHPEKVKKMAITGTNLWPDTTAVVPSVFNELVAVNDSLAKVTPSPDVKALKKLLNLMVFNPHISTADLKMVKVPTLVIGGDNDVILPKHTMAIANGIPQSYLWILPNSGHSTLIVYKEMFNQVVADFLKKPYKKVKGMSQLE
ncbi:alpha/beta fold hydrolase [Dyadobacter arcticus]|uniref:Pimeloyl-ACP methyl ester carboxylesterase n=1 Tax=Dyadobacter arcticus TaxID=1078754 RepID=A0ABX0UMJ2_9BACT|nr:alpha/beta hydrolase [Dyadobacter arcticus]NIJ54203.1 pimeloyl-ACP methyl ester carboxylesterase [Dyadobacter arcticus]